MHLNDGVRKIVTVEDPVEIDLPGVLQVQARPDIGLTFAAGLRSILRQDPDVILIGEIRDPETAKIAVQAALTGQLVISTVHTNSALGAVARLLDLGVEEYLLADVVRGLVGQRLVRRVCESCGRALKGGAEEEHARAHLRSPLRVAAPAWREGPGCLRCNRTGFQGRVGVFEAVEIDAEMATLIRHRASEAELEAVARRHGFRSMTEDGLMKARAGLTTLRETLRVVGL
jgi:general secretion pathway protein E